MTGKGRRRWEKVDKNSNSKLLHLPAATTKSFSNSVSKSPDAGLNVAVAAEEGESPARWWGKVDKNANAFRA